MATVRVVLRKCRKLKDGRYPIAIRLTNNKKVKYIFTGHSALEREWSGKYPLYLNSKHPNQKELNAFLLKEYSKTNDELIKLNIKGKPFTVHDLYSKSTNKPSPTTLFKFAENLIDKLTKSGRIGNAENYKTAINSVKRFSDGKDFQFEEINYKWLTDFETYHYFRGNSPVSLSVYLRSIRSLFNKAIMHGIVEESYYPFGRNKYTIPTGPSRKRAISKEGIIKIEELELPKDSPIWHARNYFLFSFYTMGMNWSDMAHLKMKNIVNDRIEYIRLKTKRKTVKSFSIKINSKILDILILYTNGKENDEYVFPIIKRTDSPSIIREDIKNRLRRYNKNLERIGNLCGIKEKLTSYALVVGFFRNFHYSEEKVNRFFTQVDLKVYCTSHIPDRWMKKNMRFIAIIIVTVLILTSCSKDEFLPISIVNLEIEDQKFEAKLYRFSKIKMDQSDLFRNDLAFRIDSLVYNDLNYIAFFRLKAFVYYHPDSTSYSNDLSSLSIEMVNKSDSSITQYASEICNQKKFDLVINQIEWVDVETGYYSGRFQGELCDSNKTSILIIKNGELIRARL